jgi:hypothetical protein
MNSTATDSDRVRRNTTARVLRKIDEQTADHIDYYSAQPAPVMRWRIGELEREWSVERWLEVNASTLGFTTAVLALTVNKRFGLLTCAFLGFFLLHALQGFDPPLPLLRALGVRTRREIDEEIFALKRQLQES